ncbi:MAG: EAL domain-containing protein [Propionibacteriales bacterium]|nr:EAL domain-containing protein [Propionibacteriales bacterium]
MCYLHIRPQRMTNLSDNVEDVTLDEVLFVAMLVMLDPLQCFAIMSLASLSGSVAARRAPVKMLFNLGQLIAATALAVLATRLIGGERTTPPDLLNVLGGMVGSFTLTATSALLVRAMVCYAAGQPFRELGRDLGNQLVPWGGAVTLGGVGTVAILHEPFVAILVFFVMLFVQTAYASSLREYSARRHAERVQIAIGRMRNQTDAAAVLDDLTHATRSLMAADIVRISPNGVAIGPPSLSARVSGDLQLVVVGRRGVGAWTEQERETLRTLAGVASDVLRSTTLVGRLRALTNSQSEGVFAVDLDGMVTFANPAALSMTGFEFESEVIGRPIREICDLRHGHRRADLRSMVRALDQAQDVDATLVHPSDDRIEVAYSLTPMRESDSHPGAVLVLRDVTERRALQNAIAHRALHDELTGLPNRRLLLDRLDHALARLNRDGGQHGLLFLDLDRFKLINDSFGHLAGDRLLADIANRLRESLSSADTIARFSGDEFVVLIEDVESTEQATKIAQRMLDGLEPSFKIGDTSVYISASFGVTMVRAGHTRDELLASADRAAYLAKAAGRSNVQVSADNVLAQSRNRLDMESDLHRAIEAGTLELHYQPIVHTADDTVIGVEALVRWPTDRGMINPDEFIPVAEETGLITSLGRWVLVEACRSVHEWTIDNASREPLRVSVNVSPRQFTAASFTDEVATVLADTGLDPKQLCLEITESVLMTDSNATLRTIHQIRQLGVRVAVDDFGVGYSSLGYLKRFPVDIVKLDRSFTSGLGHDVVDGEIVATVLRLTEALGIEAVAEGVETPTQRKRLLLLGCQLMQGFLASRPLSEGAFLTYWGLRSTQRATN